ncbi:MAG: thermonuclease family protein [Pseudomonadota bacterium]
MVSVFLGALAVAVGLSSGVCAQTLSGPARVIDGDTLRVAGETVRLFAVDAPEAAQVCRAAASPPWACGAAATAALEALVAEGVRCTGRGRDRFGRLVALCQAGGRDVADDLVRAGLAVASPRFGLDYVSAEKAALFAGRGLWADGHERADAVRSFAPSLDALGPDALESGASGPNALGSGALDTKAPNTEALNTEALDTEALDIGALGAVRQSAAQRHGRPLAAVPGENCAIKGNISGGGRIYHLPGQRHYARTRIDPARGERWLCSAADAAAAGWRPARR